MNWDFTPTQVMEGEVDYSLEEFLRDLWNEVRSNLSKEDFSHLLKEEERDRRYNEAIDKVFYFIYGICHLAVTKKKYLKAVLKQSNEVEREIIKKTIKENKDNVAMLHAILMRRIAKGRKNGLTKKQAAKAAVEYSKQLVCKWQMKTYKNKQNKDDNLKGKSSGKDKNLSETLIKV
jgi:hypothetical protein